ncbi:hypothetical protein [Marinoscillum sp. MHG1-6]|uniref:hypothetical protein n=1 Tax=Marinoscillum sp. MHG1-6 TaxID=2959627 RepID=UPI00215848AC|nr:hypothetical protein [Marinoscillum sp. MHG1-6]
MKYTLTILSILITLIGTAQSVETNHWKTLEELEYEKSQDDYGEIYIPKFSNAIKALAGKEISLSGYIIPFEGMFKPDHLIISSLPIASCFFCGGAGPESVAEVYLDETVKYTAKKVTVKGVLTLNDKNMDELMYILKDAKLIQ